MFRSGHFANSQYFVSLTHINLTALQHDICTPTYAKSFDFNDGTMKVTAINLALQILINLQWG